MGNIPEEVRDMLWQWADGCRDSVDYISKFLEHASKHRWVMCHLTDDGEKDTIQEA